MRVLVVNAGSSTLKLRLLDGDDRTLADRELSAPGGEFDEAAAGAVLGELQGVDAIGHRVVHGGARLTGPVRLDEAVEAELRGLVDLAPLHEPPALAGIDLVRRLLPGVTA